MDLDLGLPALPEHHPRDAARLLGRPGPPRTARSDYCFDASAFAREPGFPSSANMRGATFIAMSS